MCLTTQYWVRAPVAHDERQAQAANECPRRRLEGASGTRRIRILTRMYVDFGDRTILLPEIIAAKEPTP